MNSDEMEIYKVCGPAVPIQGVDCALYIAIPHYGSNHAGVTVQFEGDMTLEQAREVFGALQRRDVLEERG